MESGISVRKKKTKGPVQRSQYACTIAGQLGEGKKEACTFKNPSSPPNNTSGLTAILGEMKQWNKEGGGCH